MGANDGAEKGGEVEARALNVRELSKVDRKIGQNMSSLWQKT